jgi:hypothetical protein
VNPAKRFYEILVHPTNLEQYEEDNWPEVIGQLFFNVILSLVIPIALVSTGWFPSFNSSIADAAGNIVSFQQALAITLGISTFMFLLLLIGNFLTITVIGALRGGIRPFEVFKILVYGSAPVIVSKSIPGVPSIVVFGLIGYSAYIVHTGLQQIEGMEQWEALKVFLGAQFIQILFAGLLILVAAFITA